MKWNIIIIDVMIMLLCIATLIYSTVGLFNNSKTLASCNEHWKQEFAAKCTYQPAAFGLEDEPMFNLTMEEL